MRKIFIQILILVVSFAIFEYVCFLPQGELKNSLYYLSRTFFEVCVLGLLAYKCRSEQVLKQVTTLFFFASIWGLYKEIDGIATINTIADSLLSILFLIALITVLIFQFFKNAK